ncbi:MAG: hypothetical protein ACTHMZ_01890 [Actinomycetes bacterium]
MRGGRRLGQVVPEVEAPPGPAVAPPPPSDPSPNDAAAPSRGVLADLARGAAAGVYATGPMTLELAAGKLAARFGEIPPRIVTRRTLEHAGLQPSPWVSAALTGVTHTSFGAAGGAGYAAIQRRRGGRPSVASGVAYATGIYLASYGCVLPLLRLSPAIWRDKRSRQVTLLVGHWVYGAFLARRLARTT